MTLKPLKIEASPLSWDIKDLHHASPDNESLPGNLRKTYAGIIKRDKYTCRYCGFAARHHQEVHHLDHNHGNLDENNLVCACALCHRSFHLHALDEAHAAQAVWLPEITQVELNHICRAAAVAEYRHGQPENGKHPAQDAYKALWEYGFASRADRLREMLGDARLHSLSALAQLLINTDRKQSVAEKPIADNIKLFHLPHSLRIQAAYWSEHMPDFERWHALGLPQSSNQPIAE